MKNKTFISFLVNLLIGIIFSFPVFSSQNSLEDFINSNQDYDVCESVSGTSSFTDFNFYTAIHFKNHHLTDALPAKLFKSNLTTGNKVNHFSDSTPSLIKNQHRVYSLTDIQYANSCFVNLSYLKELKTTKMLC